MGANDLVKSLGGTYKVATSLTGVTSPAQAQVAFNSVDGPSSSPLMAAASVGPSAVVPLSIPTTSFVVSITATRLSGTTKTQVDGKWNWKDDFVGQGDPYDIAALQFSSGCGTMGSYAASTYKWDGTLTSQATLRDAGVATHVPLWNIDAYPVGFVNLADHGTVRVRYDRSGCGTVQTAFAYNGNKAASLTSVSVGWGLLSVNLSGSSWELQKSTGALTL